jgi:long-subunit acyl-CoA synthetase (AMP-forming)
MGYSPINPFPTTYISHENMGANEAHLYDNVNTSSNIAEAYWKRAALTPNAPLYKWATASSADATRVWHTETYTTTASKIARLAHYLRSLGVGVGTTVAIMSQTRPEWMIADLAIQTLGGITVSIYQSLPAHEAGYILFDSKAELLFVENEEQAQKIAHLRSNLCPIPEHEGVPAHDAQLSITHVISFERVQTLSIPTGHSVIEDDTLSAEPPPVPRELGRHHVASYVYTSGTTGPPKGVIQTHGNHLTNVEQVSKAGVFLLDGSLFLYLPLAHSFARLAYYVGVLTSATSYFPRSPIIEPRRSTSRLPQGTFGKRGRVYYPPFLDSLKRWEPRFKRARSVRASSKRSSRSASETRDKPTNAARRENGLVLLNK